MEAANQFNKVLNPLNSVFKKSMIHDNRIEVVRHKIITKNTGMKIYFVHPY